MGPKNPVISGVITPIKWVSLVLFHPTYRAYFTPVIAAGFGAHFGWIQIDIRRSRKPPMPIFLRPRHLNHQLGVRVTQDDSGNAVDLPFYHPCMVDLPIHEWLIFMVECG